MGGRARVPPPAAPAFRGPTPERKWAGGRRTRDRDVIGLRGRTHGATTAGGPRLGLRGAMGLARECCYWTVPPA